MSNLSTLLAGKGIVIGTGTVTPPPVVVPPDGGTGTVINITGTGDPGLTRAQAKDTNFSAPPQAIRTIGFNDPTDQGGGLHVKVAAIPTGHPAWFQTRDGSIYELQPEAGVVTLPQFGARPMSQWNTQPAPGSAEDSYAAFVAVDKYVAAHNGVRVLIPGNIWYISKTMNFNRASYILDGQSMLNTMVRCPANMSAFVNAHNYGVGHDYTIPSTNTTYQRGQAIYKLAGQVGAGNAYRCVVGGTTSANDDILTDTANNPSATYTWGTSQWKFEKNIGPNSPYDYNINYPSSAQMQFRNMTIWSFWDNNSADPNVNKWPDQMADAGGEPAYYSGIVLRCRGIVENVATLQFPGFGCAAVANGDPYIKGAGNVNGYEIRHLFTYYNGKAGWHVGYSDANAGAITYIDSAFNGRAGIEEFSFLGNGYDFFQSANDGQIGAARKQYPSGCIYNGKGWLARTPILGFDSDWPQNNPHHSLNDEPGGAGSWGWIPYFNQDSSLRGSATGSVTGTQLTVTATSLTTIAVGDMLKGTGITPGTRIVTGGTGTGGTGIYNLDTSSSSTGSISITLMNMSGSGGSDFWDWTPTQKFERGGSWLSNNRNARNAVWEFYIEGGCFTSQLGFLDVVIGGLTQTIDTSKGGVILNDGAWNSVIARGQHLFDSPRNNIGNVTTLGGFDRFGPRIFTHQHPDGRTMALRYGKGDGTNGQDHQDIVLDDISIGVDGGGKASLLITTDSTARKFGRSAIVPGALWSRAMIIPGPNSNVFEGYNLFYAASPPSGDYADNEVCLILGATSGQVWGYKRQGGSWHAMGTLT